MVRGVPDGSAPSSGDHAAVAERCFMRLDRTATGHRYWNGYRGRLAPTGRSLGADQGELAHVVGVHGAVGREETRSSRSHCLVVTQAR